MVVSEATMVSVEALLRADGGASMDVRRAVMGLLRRDGLLSPQDAARALGVHRSTLYRWGVRRVVDENARRRRVWVRAEDVARLASMRKRRV